MFTCLYVCWYWWRGITGFGVSLYLLQEVAAPFGGDAQQGYVSSVSLYGGGEEIYVCMCK